MPEPLTSIATLTGVSCTLGGAQILSSINLSLASRGITAIMGYNGAGKSTLLRVLAGLLRPTEGSVSWSLPQLPAGETAHAFVFQRPVILRRSVAANISHALTSFGLSRQETERRTHEVLQTCRLSHLFDAPARRLSGGEQQRLAMARVLARRPRILLLDEPTASLDPSATAAIETIVQQSVDTGMRAVIVTHDAAQARRMANDIVFLSNGTVAEHTDTESFFENPAHQAARDYLAGRLPTEDT